MGGDPEITRDFVVPANYRGSSEVSSTNFPALGSRLNVGSIDINTKLYEKTLKNGGMFVFPKGLVHYQSNDDPKQPSTAISAFGSADAGTVSVPLSVFTSGIDDYVLARAFKTDVATIQKLKKGLAPRA